MTNLSHLIGHITVILITKKIDKILLNYIENSLKEKKSKISEFEEIKNGKNFSLRLIKFTALRNIFRNYRHNLNYEKAEILRKYFNNFNKIKKLDEKNKFTHCFSTRISNNKK